MTDASLDSAEGIQDATSIAQHYIKEHRDDEWQRVVNAKNRGDSWEIEFKTDGSDFPQSVRVEKESGNIVEVDLSE